jgi:mannosyltransferase OCH1-like enzyme
VKFWTDSSAHAFIATHYPSFLHTYESYPHPIQRADAVRYFLLYHYGGIYLDLDLAPYRPLTPLLQYPSFACLTMPTGISNDALGSVPRHPFYKLVIDSLEAYDRNWLVRYITIMYSTGPLFLSVTWIEFLHGLGRKGGEMDRVRVLAREEKEGDSYGFFNNLQGGSWHGKDVETIFWMGRHWFVVTVVGFVIGFAVTGILWCVVRKMTGLLKRWREGKGWKSWEQGGGYTLVDLV